MKVINIVKKLPWVKSNGKLNLKTLQYLVVHHDGIAIPKRYNTMERIKNEALYHITKGWNHFSYHYCIDNIGDIYLCVPENEVNYHAGNLPVNKNSLAVVVQGNFEVQKINSKQEKALADFIKWITTQRADLPLIVKSTVKLHREVRVGGTSCPGKNLIPIINKLRK